MILRTPGLVTFVGIDSRGSGTGNPHFIVVAITVFIQGSRLENPKVLLQE